MVHKKGVIIAAFNPSNDFKIAIACLGANVRSDMLCSVLKKNYSEFEESAVWPRAASRRLIMIAIILTAGYPGPDSGFLKFWKKLTVMFKNF